MITLYLVTTRVEEIVGESGVGLEQIGFESSGWFYSHLGAVLEDVDRELVAGHTGQPQTEIPVYLYNTNKLSANFHSIHWK